MRDYIVKWDITLKRVLAVTLNEHNFFFDSIWENADTRQRSKGPVKAVAFWDPDWLFLLVEADDPETAEKLALDWR
jgi:hypothetical protein